ncbi:MAG: zinc-binding dehydrogenase [Anaerolineae bacterium]|nr:zinc-binding dehydrogenase [Anaerolineae bacterium]
MKAAVIERPGVLLVREVPDPEPGEYEALCEMLYGATCSGTDHHLLSGRFPWPVSYPTILGHESIGRVIVVGRRVRSFRVGQLLTRVGAPPIEGLNVNWGGFAELGIARDHEAMREDGLPAEAWHAYRVNQVLPEGCDPRAATMVITWRETYSYITRMGVGAGASVLVLGSGGNGLAFVRHAVNLGAGEVVQVGNPAREGLGRAAGAAHYLDYRAPDLCGPLAELASGGFDFIIDAVGRRGEVDRVLPSLRPGGTVGIYGIDDYADCAIHPHHSRRSFTVYNGGYDEAEAHGRVVTLWQQGRLDARLWLDLDHPFALDRIAEAMAAVRERRLVKALVRLSSSQL